MPTPQETSNLNIVLARTLLEDFRRTAESRAINGSELLRRFIEKFNKKPEYWSNLVLTPTAEQAETKAPA